MGREKEQRKWLKIIFYFNDISQFLSRSSNDNLRSHCYLNCIMNAFVNHDPQSAYLEEGSDNGESKKRKTVTLEIKLEMIKRSE